MNNVLIVPFPPEHDLFIGLEIAQSKYSKRNRVVLIKFRILVRAAKDGTEDGVRLAATAHEAGLVACNARIQGDVEGRAKEVDVGFGHPKMGVGVEWVAEIGGRRDDGGGVRGDELGGRDGLDRMYTIRRRTHRWIPSDEFRLERRRRDRDRLDSDAGRVGECVRSEQDRGGAAGSEGGRRGTYGGYATPVCRYTTETVASLVCGDDILCDGDVRVSPRFVDVDMLVLWRGPVGSRDVDGDTSFALAGTTIRGRGGWSTMLSLNAGTGSPLVDGEGMALTGLLEPDGTVSVDWSRIAVPALPSVGDLVLDDIEAGGMAPTETLVAADGEAVVVGKTTDAANGLADGGGSRRIRLRALLLRSTAVVVVVSVFGGRAVGLLSFCRDGGRRGSDEAEQA